MTSRKRPETLRTKGQPREILARMRPAFRDHVKPHTHNREGERLGGGSILNARWDHRLSRDIDVYVNLRTTEDGRTVLDRAAAACGGYRSEHRTFRRIEFERNKDNHVDVSFGKPTPGEGEQTAVVDGEPALVLSTAQIMSGKLQGRGMTAPGRDLVDIAACREADPEALEIAVNGLPDETVQAILKVYQELETAYGTETSELEGVPDGLRPVIENPTGYAGNAIQNARYERVDIRARHGVAEIETATQEGSRLRTYKSAEQLQSGMERDGINAFLTAQVRDQQAVLNATVEALRTGRDDLILRIEPERLTRARADVPALTWQPGREDDGPGGQTRPRGKRGDEPPPPNPGPTPAQGTVAATRAGSAPRTRTETAMEHEKKDLTALKPLQPGGDPTVKRPPPRAGAAATKRNTRRTRNDDDYKRE